MLDKALLIECKNKLTKEEKKFNLLKMDYECLGEEAYSLAKENSKLKEENKRLKEENRVLKLYKKVEIIPMGLKK